MKYNGEKLSFWSKLSCVPKLVIRHEAFENCTITRYSVLSVEQFTIYLVANQLHF